MSDLKRWFSTLLSGKPHFVVGSPESPYLYRWFLIPRNRWLNVYLHKFLRDDEDRALHDHPWNSVSVCLRGGYDEQTDAGVKRFRVGSVKYRSATYRHRVIVSTLGRPAWTLFITGRRVREWGFWCPKGFIHWQDFCDPTDGGQVGKGCDE